MNESSNPQALRAEIVSRLSSIVSRWLPTLVFLYAGYERRWAGDDGFINTRVVKQLVDGNGFVFNAGERAEAVTSAGWVFILWALAELGLDIDNAGCVASLTLSFLGMAAAGAAAELITRPTDQDGSRTLVLPLGLLAYSAIPVAWDYETSLLENGLGLAFLGTAYWLMARVVADRPTSTAFVAGFIGLAPLVRPDFAIYAAPLLFILLIRESGLRKRLLIAVSGALPGGAFQLFRMGYFASLVPNTAIAKEAFDARWDQGFLYLENTTSTYALWIPLFLCAAALAATLFRLFGTGNRMHGWVLGSLAISGMLHVLYVVRLGGDFMHGRMLLPGLFAIFASIGVVRVRTTLPRELWSSSAIVLVMAVWAVWCAKSFRPEMFVHDILDERRWWSDTSGVTHPTRVEDYAGHKFYTGPSGVKAKIAEGCPAGMASLGDDIGDVCRRVAWPDALDGKLRGVEDGQLLPLNTKAVAPHVVAVYAFRPLGIAGRLMGLRVNLTDSFGLADPLASRVELTHRGRPGHEKVFDIVWWAAKYTSEDAAEDERVQVARRALSCGVLRELFDATHQPLSLSRFLHNIPLALVLHRVRVPTDPRLAVQRFCGS